MKRGIKKNEQGAFPANVASLLSPSLPILRIKMIYWLSQFVIGIFTLLTA